MTQRVLVGEQTRRTQADEEMRAARVAAEQKVAAMQHEIMTLLHGDRKASKPFTSFRRVRGSRCNDITASWCWRVAKSPFSPWHDSKYQRVSATNTANRKLRQSHPG